MALSASGRAGKRAGVGGLETAASLLVAALLGLVAGMLLVWGRAGTSEARGELARGLSQVEVAVKGLELRLLEQGASSQAAFLRDLSEARRALEGLRVAQEERRRLEDELRTSSRRIEAVLAGSQSRGAAGERVLGEALAQFPAGMIERNFKVRGRPVEYALILADGRRLALDSKWPAGDLLERLEVETDPARREALGTELERAVLKKAREAAQYIDPATTLPWAVAALPDAAYSACPRARWEAWRERVLLMPYSLAAPFVLTLHQLHLQYARSLDAERLGSYLKEMERGLDGLEKVLENSVARAAVMAQNAYGESRRLVAGMRAALTALEGPPTSAVPPGELPGLALPLPDEAPWQVAAASESPPVGPSGEG